MKNDEIVDQLTNTHQENLSKFVYFLFSITTISIGYSISITQKAQVSYCLILWIISIIAMGYSLWCGISHIKKINDTLLHTANILRIDDACVALAQKDDEQLKKDLIENTPTNSTPISSPSKILIYDTFIPTINEKATEAGKSFVEYINDSQASTLRQIITNHLLSLFKYSGINDAIEKMKSSENKANFYLNWQLWSLLIGFALFFLWHLSNIFIK